MKIVVIGTDGKTLATRARTLLVDGRPIVPDRTRVTRSSDVLVQGIAITTSRLVLMSLEPIDGGARKRPCLISLTAHRARMVCAFSEAVAALGYRTTRDSRLYELGRWPDAPDNFERHVSGFRTPGQGPETHPFVLTGVEQIAQDPLVPTGSSPDALLVPVAEWIVRARARAFSDAFALAIGASLFLDGKGRPRLLQPFADHHIPQT